MSLIKIAMINNRLDLAASAIVYATAKKINNGGAPHGQGTKQGTKPKK